MKPRAIPNAGYAIWYAREFLQNTLRNGVFPAYLAKALGMTRLEAELTLRLLVARGMAIRRHDGRYYHKPLEKQS